MTTLRVDQFDFQLPEELIARYPMPERTSSRLLHLQAATGQINDKSFSDLPQYIHAGDLLVLNNTRVIPARLFGQKPSGGKVEILVERITRLHTVLAHVRASKSPKEGATLLLENIIPVTVTGRQGELFALQFDTEETAIALIEKHGHIPLPPYMERPDELMDWERYQTVYAQHQGSVAAPTAGLHFDTHLLTTLQQQGVNLAYVTLHVGAGTFQPVRTEYVHEHQMHYEYLEVPAETVQKIQQTKQNGHRVIAVGTTSVRSLETAAKTGELHPYQGETNLFIYPGYQFNVVDAMITNFHLPKSSLLMLVSAFAGYQHIMNAYAHAIANKYRFYSYGDAMLIEK